MPETLRRDGSGWPLISGEFPLKAERIQLALDAGRTGIWVWDSATGEFTGDSGMAALWGLPRSVTMTMHVLRTSLSVENMARVEAEMRATAQPGGADACQIEFRIRRSSDGAERWIAIHGRRFQPEGPDGPVELIGMARDITARKDRETHMHLLMREVTHRSKNLLAIIQAMARQTVKDSLSATEFEERFSARLRGLAVSHDLLAAKDWHGAAIEDLVRWQLASVLDKAPARVAINGPMLVLKPEAAQNIGLAFNELATNAMRFGALSGETGQVAVDWSLDAADVEPRRFHIGWRETGGPQVSPPRRYGFGHKVMERLAARALDGTVSLTFGTAGLQWSLHIPASFVLDGALPAPTTG